MTVEVKSCAQAGTAFAGLLATQLLARKHSAIKVERIRARTAGEVSSVCTRDDWPPSTFTCLSSATNAETSLDNCQIPNASQATLAAAMRTIVSEEMRRSE